MFTHLHGTKTLVLRTHGNTYAIWHNGPAPAGFETCNSTRAALLAQQWIRDGILDRYRQADIYRASNPSASLLLLNVNDIEMSNLLLTQVNAGRVRIGQLDNQKPSHAHLGYETAIIPADPATKAPERTVRVAKFAGTGYAEKAGLANLTDDACPSDNHRSESTATCQPAVNEWFKTKQVPIERQNTTLGSDGGGGFERHKTTVKFLPAGTPLYRYVDSATWPWGGWWFLQPLDGNPCVLAALPADSAATVMVKAKLKKGVHVLYGPGAPRCSNKPGGPEQVLMARSDFHPHFGDILDIEG
jgi:hypothetical protein